MKTERILTSRIPNQTKNDNDTVTITVPKKTLKTASMLTYAMLCLAAMAKADVKKVEIDPYDLSYESSNEFDRNYFENYVKNYPELKRFSRVDKNTLRTINEADMVVDHIIKDGVHDTKILGYARIPDLYPQGHDVPLTEQKYDTYESYMRQKKAHEILDYFPTWGTTATALLLMLIIANAKRNNISIDDNEDKIYGYGSKAIDKY